jgi:hypothetical protein
MIRTVMVPLRNGGEVSLWICNICGAIRQGGTWHPCDGASERVEKPADVRVGDVVTLSSEYGSKVIRARSRITGLLYASPDLCLPCTCFPNPGLHELCVDISEELDNGVRALTTMTYREFCIRRDGKPEELQELGILPKPKPPGFFARLFSRRRPK